MSILEPERWQAVSGYLDEVLEMPEDARTEWLDILSQQQPEVAADLRSLIDEHRALDDERFLEGPLPLPAIQPSLTGETFGAYTIVAPLGQGGMGSVWRAERSDGRFDRQVAIKLLHPAVLGRGGEERFTREGRILARLVHPLIAQLVDAGVSRSGQPYLVLEHVAGEHIDQYCGRKALDLTARIQLFLDVLAAVAHAHANLVVHRDLKPSNVLVTPDGGVKLLDFGIAKLLEDDTRNGMSLTREAGVALTPQYAAPEQLTGASITTATDVYSLGVLLYTLLCGRHPAGDAGRSTAEMVKAIVEIEPARMSQASGRPFDRDLETIVGKALKKAPQERYASVTAMADDLGRFLRHEPISARPDTLAYRAAKFARRNRVAVIAATLALIALGAGLFEINRQRMIAERRFIEVRQLANKLFDVDALVRQLPGSSKVRQTIVDTALDYLRRLGAEVQGDPDLALEVGTAYMRVARVQGVPISPNLGQAEQAEQNLQTAEALVRSVLAAEPGNRSAFLRIAQIAHDRMILAGNRRPDDQALPLAEQSASWMARYIDSGTVDPAETQQVLIAMNNVANRFRIERRYDEALRLGYRAIDLAGTLKEPLQGGSLLMNTAYIHRDRGELNEALIDIRRAVQVLTPAPAPGVPDQGRMANLALALSREGAILGEIDHVSLAQAADAVKPLERSFQISDDYAHKDPTDSLNRGHLQPAVMILARLLRDSDATRSLALYDHLLLHLGEIKNNAQFRRYEARALAASTYPLARLGRLNEARERLDGALGTLKDMKLYPAQQVELGSEVDDALRAEGDLEASRGDVPAAIRTYTTLLELVMASKPAPDDDLADAVDLSRLYASLASLEHRADHDGDAGSLDRRRLELWQRWDRKLSGNALVRRELDAANAGSAHPLASLASSVPPAPRH